jgi:uncharacterized protein DUF1259
MKIVSLTLLFLLAGAPGSPAQSAGAWDTVDKVFAAPGKDMPGDVHRFGWPRGDLKVSLDGVSIEPPLALGSWAAFKKTGSGEEAIAMGDLALLDSEVDGVIRAFEAGSVEVLAVHNHLIGETPRIVYVHFHGHGPADALATTIRQALEKTKTPLASGSSAKPSADDEKTYETVQGILGRKGTMAGRVLQLGVPRALAIRDSGIEIPPAMGMATAINFQAVGARVATTGDFVLVADEVNPVIRELQSHGIAVMALHSHMLREEPRLFFMHFWGLGTPEKIGEGLKAALAKVATK